MLVIPAAVLVAVSIGAWQASSSTPVPTPTHPNEQRPTVHTENCGGGIAAVKVIPAPGFDPLTATQDQLRANGFPPRPTDPDAVAEWRQYVTTPVHHNASCANLTTGHPGHGMMRAHTAMSPAGSSDGCHANSCNWSGWAANNAVYYDVEASWNVPAGYGDGDVYAYSSSWIGIGLGDYRDYPLIQAGTESNGNGSDAHDRFLWWEVYPQLPNQIKVRSLIGEGDSMYVHVHAWDTGANFHIVDSTQHFDQTYTYSGSWHIDGHAEWMLERTEINGSLPELSRSTTTFVNTYAAGAGLGWTALGSLSKWWVNMYTCDGTENLAWPTGVTDDGVSFTDYWPNFGGGYPDRDC